MEIQFIYVRWRNKRVKQKNFNLLIKFLDFIFYFSYNSIIKIKIQGVIMKREIVKSSWSDFLTKLVEASKIVYCGITSSKNTEVKN